MRSASVAAQAPLPPSAVPASAATICAALRPKAIFELALIYPGEEQLGSIVGPRKGAPNLPVGPDQCDLEIVQQVLIVVPVGNSEHPRYPARVVLASTNEMPVVARELPQSPVLAPSLRRVGSGVQADHQEIDAQATSIGDRLP